MNNIASMTRFILQITSVISQLKKKYVIKSNGTIVILLTLKHHMMSMISQRGFNIHSTPDKNVLKCTIVYCTNFSKSAK